MGLSSIASLNFRPWLEPLRDAIGSIGDCNANRHGDYLEQCGASAHTHWVTLADCLAQSQQIKNYKNQLIRFAPQQLNTKQAYELGIAQTGVVTCRTAAAGFSGAQERHDWYNALMWLQFPRTKALLNQLQAGASLEQIANDHPSGSRGALRDALTVFDENALILCHNNPTLIALLRNKQWTTALHTLRSEWGCSIKPLVFGHALAQKLDQPFKSITAHAYVLTVPEQDLFKLDKAQIDAALHRSLAQISWPEKPFLPLPVMGIPKWSESNTDVSFYNDPKVFRP